MEKAVAQQNVLSEYFRCPEEALPYDVKAVLRPQAGFFKLGTSILYGQLANGDVVPSAASPLWDALPELDAQRDVGVLPFDPSQIALNLRFEKYVREQFRGTSEVKGKRNIVRNGYYLLRPLLPVNVRKHLQRFSLRKWRQIPFPNWPVDVTVDQFHRTLLRLLMKHHQIDALPFIWFWPEGLPACIIMTHDVEAPAGKNFCDTLMDLNDSFAIKSSFQVVPEERYPVEAAWLKRIRTRGFEVNVHDLNHDGHLFDNEQRFLRRAAKINEYGRIFGAAGFRAGVLYRNQEWLPHLAFEYDMSVPNVGHFDPQRGGCCTVMPYFVGNLVELPVTCTQDYSLFNILQDYSTNLWRSQIERILQFNGMASFIVHPDYVIEPEARDTYSQLLSRLRELRTANRAWLPLPGEVARWWRDRSHMTLLRRENRWVIEGPSCERARVAFARIEHNELRFQLANGCACE